MSIYSETKRDRAVSRSIIKLFIEAMAIRPFVFILCFLSIPVTIITSVIAPLLIAITVEDMVNHNYHSAEVLIWTLGALMLFNIVLRSFWNFMFNIDGIEGAKYLHKKIFTHMMNQDYDFFSNQFTGALASYQQRMLAAFIDFNNFTLLAIPQILTIIIGSTIVLFFRSPILGFITLACVLLISLATVVAALLRLNQRRELSYQNGRLAGQLSDSLSHATTVKALGKEKRETTRFLTYVESWAKSQSNIWISYIYGDATRTFFHTIMFVAILLVSLALFRDGKIGVATVTLIQLYTISLLNATVQIADLIKRYEGDMSDSYQMMLLLQKKPSINDPLKPVKLENTDSVAVAFEEVGFNYDSDATQGEVLHNLSFKIKPGEKVGIVGPSGAGKTTITKLILRFYDAASGSIEFNGVDARDLSQEYLRSLIAYVPQEPLLFYRSIKENISYAGNKSDEENVESVADKANVLEFTSQYRDGLDTLVGERGVKLSGGQRQRVAIARAMLRNSPILVLDEATSALDSETESLIQDALWKLMVGKTAIVIAHRLSTIHRMDRIIVIDHGKLLEQGSHEELLKKSGVYAKLWKHQSGGFIGEV